MARPRNRERQRRTCGARNRRGTPRREEPVNFAAVRQAGAFLIPRRSIVLPGMWKGKVAPDAAVRFLKYIAAPAHRRERNRAGGPARSPVATAPVGIVAPAARPRKENHSFRWSRSCRQRRYSPRAAAPSRRTAVAGRRTPSL